VTARPVQNTSTDYTGDTDETTMHQPDSSALSAFSAALRTFKIVLSGRIPFLGALIRRTAL
jgi:hypothetical protein